MGNEEGRQDREHASVSMYISNFLGSSQAYGDFWWVLAVSPTPLFLDKVICAFENMSTRFYWKPPTHTVPTTSKLWPPLTVDMLSRHGFWVTWGLVRTFPHLAAHRGIVSLASGVTTSGIEGAALCYVRCEAFLPQSGLAHLHLFYYQKHLNDTREMEMKIFLSKFLLPPTQNKIGTMPCLVPDLPPWVNVED